MLLATVDEMIEQAFRSAAIWVAKRRFWVGNCLTCNRLARQLHLLEAVTPVVSRRGG